MPKQTKQNRSASSNTFQRASYPDQNETMATITVKLPKYIQLHFSIEAKKLNKSLSLIIIELLSKKLGEPVPAASAAGAAPAAAAGKKTGTKKKIVNTLPFDDDHADRFKA
jgi:predicted CopG family antitoxin